MKFRHWIIISILSLAGMALLFNIGFSDTDKSEAENTIKWIKYDEGLKIAAEENKPILIDFYTKWCGFCKKMDRETFSNDKVARYLDEKFVTVKVNGESNETVALSEGSLSERQVSRSFGVRGYPTYWFLKASGEKIDNIRGYRPPEMFMTILQFIGDGHYENKTWKEYIDQVKPD
jgi:thioredoxin-related protein